jgi:plastocyanin
MRSMKSFAVLALLLAACGGDDTVTKMDSGMGSGSGSGSGNAVQTVTCSGTPAAVVSTDNAMMKYIYSTTTAPSVPVGSVIEFKMSTAHNVAPGLAPTDPGLKVDYGADVCLKFTKAGTFNFLCQAHSFTGSIVVN